MARFFNVVTDTGYSEASGVRSTAKYLKSGTQAAFLHYSGYSFFLLC